MPSKSRRFKQLESAIKTLNKMLPTINVDGKYTIQQQIAIKAYRLLCHAEVEAYIEDIADQCIQSVYLKWQSSKKSSSVLIHLFAMEGWSVEKKATKNTDTRLGMLISIYRQRIKDNNGIKEKNIQALFLPLGVDLDPINTLIIDLDTFGSARGAIAHTAMKTHSILDPGVEQVRVAQIISGLEVLDSQVKVLS